VNRCAAPFPRSLRCLTVPPSRPASSASPPEWRRPTRATPVRDGRHQALSVLIGNWINEGATIAAGDIPSVPILTSDVYEWAPGGFFIVHSAFGKIGQTSVGGVEIIGVDGEAYGSTFYDSFGNVHRSRLEIDGDVLRWIGDRTRCRSR
jgi:hypothetical protein